MKWTALHLGDKSQVRNETLHSHPRSKYKLSALSAMRLFLIIWRMVGIFLLSHSTFCANMSYYSKRKLLLGHCWKHDGYGVMDVEMGNISVSYIKTQNGPKIGKRVLKKTSWKWLLDKTSPKIHKQEIRDNCIKYFDLLYERKKPITDEA